MEVLRETPAYSTPKYMIRSGFKLSLFFSLQFAVLICNNRLEVISVHKVVWTINGVGFYWSFTIINFNKIPSFRL